jgi:GntR family transcriptional regulator
VPPTARSPIPIWLTRDRSVPIHDQLVTQILLGILSDDLKAGQRLPSVRALARVLHVNSNTVSGAYRELVREGWLEGRHGSGVYVRSAPVPARSRLEELLTAFVGIARREGWTPADIRHSVERELARTSCVRLLLFEPEPELRNVLLREIEKSCGVRLGVYSDSTTAEGAMIVAMHGRAQLLERELPSHAPRLLLQVTSIPAALLRHGRPAPDTLIAIASASPEILRRARTVLLAAGIEASALVECDTRQSDWRARAMTCDLAIADILTAQTLSAHRNLRVLRVLAEDSLARTLEELSQTAASSLPAQP